MSRDDCDPRFAKLFSGNAVFIKGVVDEAGFPTTGQMEVCFAGRSNVGKSSLINAVTGTKGLARTSNTPGRTQEINYFDLSDQLFITDLPGYGYAQAPKEKVQLWNALIHDYLLGRQELKRAFLLIDARHGVKKNDEEVFDKMDKVGISYQLVFTKIDKVKPSELENKLSQADAIVKKRVAAHPRILVTSSEEGVGLNRVRAEIAALLPEYYYLWEELDKS